MSREDYNAIPKQHIRHASGWPNVARSFAERQRSGDTPQAPEAPEPVAKPAAITANQPMGSFENLPEAPLVEEPPKKRGRPKKAQVLTAGIDEDDNDGDGGD